MGLVVGSDNLLIVAKYSARWAINRLRSSSRSLMMAFSCKKSPCFTFKSLGSLKVKLMRKSLGCELDSLGAVTLLLSDWAIAKGSLPTTQKPNEPQIHVSAIAVRILRVFKRFALRFWSRCLAKVAKAESLIRCSAPSCINFWAIASPTISGRFSYRFIASHLNNYL